ncbi:MAG: RNA-binding protein [Sphingobacteriales bacterium]|nr:MAG: RNA-binding protein [Sphingobacteriales bacterium]
MKIFIGYLSLLATEQHLIDLFTAYGRVEAAYIPRNAAGAARGFGYVIMADDTLAEAAIHQLNKSQFMGQYLTVSEAISSIGYTIHG